MCYFGDHDQIGKLQLRFVATREKFIKGSTSIGRGESKSALEGDTSKDAGTIFEFDECGMIEDDRVFVIE